MVLAWVKSEGVGTSSASGRSSGGFMASTTNYWHHERGLETGGEAGIRTLDTAFRPYNGLANRRLQPLGHLTAQGKCNGNQHFADQDFTLAEATVFQTVASTRFNQNASRFTLTEYELWAHSRKRHRECSAY